MEVIFPIEMNGNTINTFQPHNYNYTWPFFQPVCDYNYIWWNVEISENTILKK